MLYRPLQAIYARKHAPFVSYKNVQDNASECARVVNAGELDRDVARRQLPDYMLYVPNLVDDGHNSGVAVADNWLARRLARSSPTPCSCVGQSLR